MRCSDWLHLCHIPASIAKHDKDYYQKKGKGTNSTTERTMNSADLTVSTVSPHLTSSVGSATLSETTYNKTNFTIG